MSLAVQHIDDIFEGNDVTFTLRVLPRPTGGIAGQSFQFAMKRTLGDAIPVVSKTVGDGLTILDATNAAIRVEVEAADTIRGTGCGPGQYRWSLRRTDEGFRTVIAYGQIKVSPKTGALIEAVAASAWSDTFGDSQWGLMVLGSVPPTPPVLS